MSRKSESKAFAEGAAAFDSGKGDDANPYPTTTDECLSWNDGYHEAEEAWVQSEELP